MRVARRPDRQYVDELGAVLRARDPEALRAFLARSAGEYGDDERQVEQVASQSPAELRALMHLMTLARPDLEDLHAESRAQLAASNPGQAGARAGRRRRRPR